MGEKGPFGEERGRKHEKQMHFETLWDLMGRPPTQVTSYCSRTKEGPLLVRLHLFHVPFFFGVM